jgi:hypothetical protein
MLWLSYHAPWNGKGKLIMFPLIDANKLEINMKRKQRAPWSSACNSTRQVHILTHKGNLPPIEPLKIPRTKDHLFEEIQQNMKQRKEDIEIAKNGDNNLMEENLSKLSKTQTMIQAFMANLKRDMKTLSNNSSSHEATLEELLYYKVISIIGQHEAWEAYMRDKDK